MATDTFPRDERLPDRQVYDDQIYGAVESRFSAVSWGAILAGGAGAAAMALILMTLGIGLGLIAVSPWRNEGASPEAIGIGVIIWSIIVHVVAYGLGGYLTGRLRTKWANAHGDEVYFRDTAHGFVTWALGMLVSFCIMTSVAGALARGTADVAAAGAGSAGLAGVVAASQMGGQMGGAPMGGGMDRAGGNPLDYFTDMLFRPAGGVAAAQQPAATDTSGATTGTATGGDTATGGTTTAPAPTTPSPTAPVATGVPQGGDMRGQRAEAGRILMTSLVNEDLAPADRTYLAQMIAARTGMTPAEAEARVDEVRSQVQTAIDTAEQKTREVSDGARKAAIGWALWTFVSMLIGAFSASYAATIGGRARDL